MAFDRSARIRELSGELSELMDLIAIDEREIRVAQDRMRERIAKFRSIMSERDALERATA